MLSVHPINVVVHLIDAASAAMISIEKVVFSTLLEQTLGFYII